MNDLVEQLSKKYGKNFVVNQDLIEELEVISTGSLSLDVSTGIGGIPKGKVSTIYGAESTGKTTLCLELVKQALLRGDKAVYIDVEQGLDYEYIKKILGTEVDLANLLVAQPETAEQSLGLAELMIQGDKKVGISPGEFGLIIIDSVAALAPNLEREKELTDANVALTSRILGPFFRRNMYAIKNNKVAVVFVNQVRDKIKSYVGGYELTGGHALKHYSSIIIFLTVGEKFTQGDEIIGILCKFTVRKNKLAKPYRSQSFPLMFGDGIDYYRDVYDFAKALGVLSSRGTWVFLGDEQLGQGLVKSVAYLKEHPETLDKIIKMCYNTLNESGIVFPIEDDFDGKEVVSE